MAAEIDFTRPNPAGEPEVVFLTARAVGTFFYDVMPDGRFVILEPVADDDSQASQPIYMRITQNWYEEFRDHERD